jgi:hypothetical protein
MPFKQGQFSMKDSPLCFNDILSYMTTEIRHCWSDKKESAAFQGKLKEHVLSKYAASMHKRVGSLPPTDGPYDQCMPSFMKSDEEHLLILICHSTDNMVQQVFTMISDDLDCKPSAVW